MFAGFYTNSQLFCGDQSLAQPILLSCALEIETADRDLSNTSRRQPATPVSKRCVVRGWHRDHRTMTIDHRPRRPYSSPSWVTYYSLAWIRKIVPPPLRALRVSTIIITPAYTPLESIRCKTSFSLSQLSSSYERLVGFGIGQASDRYCC